MLVDVYLKKKKRKHIKSERHHKINFTVHKGPICSQDSEFSFYYTYFPNEYFFRNF